MASRSKGSAPPRSPAAPRKLESHLAAALARLLQVRRRSQEPPLVRCLRPILAQQPFVAGDALTIADIVHFGWMWRRQFAEVSLETAPNIQRWYAALEVWPAFQRAIARVTALAEG
jgi:glutathione S-transferase